MNITLRQLKAFAAVADAGSFTHAAAELHLTQSALSSLIKDLEHNWNVRLFDRTTRQLHVSVVGQRLLPTVRRILNEMAVLQEEVDNIQNRHDGQVRLAVAQQLAASVMPRLLAAFNKRYPDIRITLIDCSVEQVLQHVRTVEADFGIGPDRSHGEGIGSEFLFSLPFYVALPPQHPLAAASAVSWQAMLEERLITLTGPFTGRLAAALPEHLAVRILKPDYQVNFLSTALSMVQSGLGLTLCLPYAGNWVRQNGLTMRPLTAPQIERRFLLYHRKSRSLSPAADTLRRYLLAEEALSVLSGRTAQTDTGM